MGIMEKALTFLSAATEKEVKVEFIKKDGSRRVMKCTLDFSKIPEKDRPKSFELKKALEQLKKNKILHVYDVENQGWRSVPLDRVTSFVVDGKESL
jgi:hypothetical protein